MESADKCRANGWKPGTRLVGNEGFGDTVIEITAIGEKDVLAKTISHEGKKNPSPYESMWNLDHRDWKKLESEKEEKQSPERGCVCMFCGKGFGYAGLTPDEATLKAAYEHEAECPRNPYKERIAKLEEALNAQKWIPVAQQKPKIREGQSEFVLVTTDKRVVHFARFFKSKRNGQWWSTADMTRIEVVAWQPMLEAYAPK
jgi:hypothetical protein